MSEPDMPTSEPEIPTSQEIPMSEPDIPMSEPDVPKSEPEIAKPRQAIRQDNVSVVCFKSFLLVAMSGSFAQAASQLGVDESTVRRNVSNLEHWLSKKLFSRSRKTALTPNGSELFPKIRNIYNLINQLKDQTQFDHMADQLNRSEEEMLDGLKFKQVGDMFLVE